MEGCRQRAGPLFDAAAVGAPARRRQAHQAAGAAVADRRVSRQIAAVLRALAELGPLTREELARHTGIKESSLCGRLHRAEYPNAGRPAWKPRLAALIDGTAEAIAASGCRVKRYAITAAGYAARRTGRWPITEAAEEQRTRDRESKDE